MFHFTCVTHHSIVPLRIPFFECVFVRISSIWMHVFSSVILLSNQSIHCVFRGWDGSFFADTTIQTCFTWNSYYFDMNLCVAHSIDKMWNFVWRSQQLRLQSSLIPFKIAANRWANAKAASPQFKSNSTAWKTPLLERYIQIYRFECVHFNGKETNSAARESVRCIFGCAIIFLDACMSGPFITLE